VLANAADFSAFQKMLAQLKKKNIKQGEEPL